MRIAILADELAPGSGPKVIGQTVRGLASLGHKVEVLVMVNKDYGDEYKNTYVGYLEGLPMRCLATEAKLFFAKFDFKFPGFSFFSLHHLMSGVLASSVIKEKEYDCIVAHNPYSAFAARSLAKKRKIPFFMLIWDPSPYTLRKVYSNTKMRYFFPMLSLAASCLDRYAYDKCLAIITSGKLHHEYLSYFTDRPLEILPCGCIPVEEFPPFSKREHKILAFDRWDVGHTPYRFLDILEALDEKINLIIGGFWYPEQIRASFIKMIKEKSLEDRVEIIGPLNEAKIIELCSKVMLYIHLNEEAFGMQSLEAAGCGCPIIIPRGSGVTDLFEHGKHGYFPQKNNISEIINYTNMIFADLEKTEQMGYEAWEIAKKYTWRRYAIKLEEVIKKYVKN